MPKIEAQSMQKEPVPKQREDGGEVGVITAPADKRKDPRSLKNAGGSSVGASWWLASNKEARLPQGDQDL